MKIKSARPVLLSAPYAIQGENQEVDLHLKSGYRTTGLVELTLEDGTKGIGEAYLAVFAPKVFVEIVNLIIPYVLGLEVNSIPAVMSRISTVTGYWSYQGAAQHVLSAFDIALHDCKAKLLGIPVYQLSNKIAGNTIALYGSGGDSHLPEYMLKEFQYLDALGIKHFKIRARNNQVKKAAFALKRGKELGIQIAVDMAQNLANPGQSLEDILTFYKAVKEKSDFDIFFLEEVLGIPMVHLYPKLKEKIPVQIAGGEIVTTSLELKKRMALDWYDIVQPDASVIGGISAILEIFEAANGKATEVFVHCWGGPVSMAANYHAAVAAGGKMAEWPMPYYPLRDSMMVEPWHIKDGMLTLSDRPGLGIQLDRDMEKQFPFREEAVYSCIPDISSLTPDAKWGN